MDKEYYINHVVLDGHLNNPIYKSIPSNTDQKVFQNLRKLVEKYSSNLTKKEKEYVLNNTWKSSKFYCMLKHLNVNLFRKQYYKMIVTPS